MSHAGAVPAKGPVVKAVRRRARKRAQAAGYLVSNGRQPASKGTISRDDEDGGDVNELVEITDAAINGLKSEIADMYSELPEDDLVKTYLSQKEYLAMLAEARGGGTDYATELASLELEKRQLEYEKALFASQVQGLPPPPPPFVEGYSYPPSGYGPPSAQTGSVSSYYGGTSPAPTATSTTNNGGGGSDGDRVSAAAQAAAQRRVAAEAAQAEAALLRRELAARRANAIVTGSVAVPQPPPVRSGTGGYGYGGQETREYLQPL